VIPVLPALQILPLVTIELFMIKDYPDSVAFCRHYPFPIDLGSAIAEKPPLASFLSFVGLDGIQPHPDKALSPGLSFSHGSREDSFFQRKKGLWRRENILTFNYFFSTLFLVTKKSLGSFYAQIFII
jgi:hypothetical protein